LSRRLSVTFAVSKRAFKESGDFHTNYLIKKKRFMKNVILGICTVFALATTSFAQNAPAEVPAKGKNGKEMKGKGKEKSEEAKAQGKDMGEQGKAHGKEMSDQGKAKGEQGKGMGASLGLTPEQQTQYGAVNKAHQEAVRKVQADQTLAADAKKAQVDALKSKYETDLKGVMNAEQYAKWSENRAKRAAEKSAEKAGEKGDAKKMEDHKDGDHKGGGDKKGGKGKGKGKTDGAAPEGASKSN
jgi:hypothetical protein